MKLKVLINPFEHIAGWKALALGITAMALTVVFGYMNRIAFDGALDIHPGSFNLSTSFVVHAVVFLVLFLIIWLTGVCFSKTKVRAIDVAGTIALARAPVLLLTIVCFLPIVPKGLYDIPRTIVFSLIVLPCFLWMIALMYNAYTVSCNLKGKKAVISFIGALIVSEIISKIILFSLINCTSIDFTPSFIENNQVKIVEIAIPKEQTINQTAAIVIEAFIKSDIKTVRVYFNETMQKSLPETALRFIWKLKTLQFGKLKIADTNVEATHYEKYDILLIT